LNHLINSALSTVKNIFILFVTIFILYNSINIINHLMGENSISQLTIKNIEGRLQQQSEIDYIQYQYQSDVIKEFEIPVINNNETGLKGITTDSKDNVWFYYNTNTSSAIIEFNVVNNTFIKYPILKKTNVDTQ
jgi:hypothetical protein